MLASDETLISYFIGEKTSYVFAVSRDSLSWKELRFWTDELNKTVSSIRMGLDFDDIQRKKASPVKLERSTTYLKILQPVDEFIRPKAKLIVVLDGALRQPAFQLLVTEVDPRAVVIAGRPISSTTACDHSVTISNHLKVLRQSASLARRANR